MMVQRIMAKINPWSKKQGGLKSKAWYKKWATEMEEMKIARDERWEKMEKLKGLR